MQHRGYSIFYKNKNSIGSIVHGNFGAINTSKIEKSASLIRRKKYSYTPIYLFKEKNLYHLVFNNPTRKDLKINILGKSKTGQKEINKDLFLSPLGTDLVIIRNFEGRLSFFSRLPICRCLVLKNPDINNTNRNFDVFHS